MLFQNELAGTA